jgi:cyd operon protein YbgT
MWYFSWVLGLGLACAFAILNAMWLEVLADDRGRADADAGRRGATPTEASDP